MLNILTSVIAFLVAIAILVPFHEFGHFWVARRLGVKVKRFAVGFGKVLLSHRAKDDVEYCVCAIPLGGYVKMLDEREGPVADADLPYAFNRQKIWKRFLIVLAGPVFNILLAYLLLMLVFKIGFEAPVPILQQPTENSPAMLNGLKEGDEILAINQHTTRTVDNVIQIWFRFLNEPEVNLAILRDHDEIKLRFTQPEIIPGKATDFLGMLGIDFRIPPELGEIAPDSPALKAGLQYGDRVVAIQGNSVNDWDDLVAKVSKYPHQTVNMEILRNGKHKTLMITPAARPDGTGMIGVHMPKAFLRTGAFDTRDALYEAYNQTYKIIALNLKLITQMATGAASFDNISGPVTIARAAGTSAEEGAASYLYFLAMVSVGLAVLNLLPIPVLDGGHLLLFMVEALLRRPLSERAQTVAFGTGFIFIILLMLIALYNDMMHWV